MAKIDNYRTYVQKVINEHRGLKTTNEEIEVQTIFDTTHDHYQLVHAGWRNDHRIYGCIVHLDIKDGKIWIQYDGTEVGIANELVALGVPKEDIVLAFHEPYKRQFTEFAVK